MEQWLSTFSNHMMVKTFNDYAMKIFLPYVHAQLQYASRVDVVWDQLHQSPRKLAAVSAYRCQQSSKIVYLLGNTPGNREASSHHKWSGCHLQLLPPPPTLWLTGPVQPWKGWQPNDSALGKCCQCGLQEDDAADSRHRRDCLDRGSNSGYGHPGGFWDRYHPLVRREISWHGKPGKYSKMLLQLSWLSGQANITMLPCLNASPFCGMTYQRLYQHRWSSKGEGETDGCHNTNKRCLGASHQVYVYWGGGGGLLGPGNCSCSKATIC